MTQTPISATSYTVKVVAALTILALSTVLAVFFIQQQPKIGYIRSKDVVFGYAGTKDIQKTLEKQVQALEGHIDIMADEYSRTIQEYENKKKTLASSEKSSYEYQLKEREKTLQQHIHNAQKKADDEEKQKMEEILEHINTVVKRYAEEHNYKFIFGTTSGGNIVYGDKALDLTEDILRELNTAYQHSLQDTVRK